MLIEKPRQFAVTILTRHADREGFIEDLFDEIPAGLRAQGLDDAPEAINADPYGEGWLWKMSVGDASALDGLMDAAAYAEFCASEDH